MDIISPIIKSSGLIYHKLNKSTKSDFKNKLNIIHNNIESISSKLSTVDKKIDHLLQRENEAAFEALHDACLSEKIETITHRLSFAEEKFLSNTSLDSSLSENYKDISFLSYIGLSYIAFINDDKNLIAKYILKAFVISPRKSRTTILKDVFDEIFLPKCKDIAEKYENDIYSINIELEELKSLEGISALKKIYNNKCKIKWNYSLSDPLVSLSLSNQQEVASILVNQYLQVDRRLQYKAINIIEDCRSSTLEQIENRFESNLDNRCITVANKYLDQMK